MIESNKGLGVRMEGFLRQKLNWLGEEIQRSVPFFSLFDKL